MQTLKTNTNISDKNEFRMQQDDIYTVHIGSDPVRL